MKFIKAHKGFFIIFFFFILLAVIAFLLLQKFIFFSGDAYGNRLEDIKDVQISSKTLQSIENAFMEQEQIKKATAYVTGRIINIIAEVEGDVSVEVLQSYTEIILQNLEEEEENLYDVQLIYKKEDATDTYPIFGYKGKGLAEFKWSYQS